MSARAMATLSRQVIAECPEILEITSLEEFEFGGETYPSSNNLLGQDQEEQEEIGTVDGLKTGWTPQAGSCMAATSVKDNQRLITITMNASAVNARYSDSRELLQTGFDILEERLEDGYAYASPKRSHRQHEWQPAFHAAYLRQWQQLRAPA